MTDKKDTEIVKKPQSALTPMAKKFEGAYMQQVEGFFNDNKDIARRFLMSVDMAMRKTPKLQECTPKSVISSFLQGAELGLMPSEVTGEFYVLPYKNKGVMEASFQLGYQGLVTLFFRAGVKKISADIVREKDTFKYANGDIYHEINPRFSMKERGEPIGAYVIADINGSQTGKFINSKDILAHGARFSKSFKTNFTPWKEVNDPELWMWKKTVLKQIAKLLPKNETISKAIDKDEDVIKNTNIDRFEEAKNESGNLKMGNFVKNEKKANKKVIDVT